MRRLWVATAVSLLLLVGGLAHVVGVVDVPGLGSATDGLTPPFVTAGTSLRLIP
jgi:hypothetical protein